MNFTNFFSLIELIPIICLLRLFFKPFDVMNVLKVSVSLPLSTENISDTKNTNISTLAFITFWQK